MSYTAYEIAVASRMCIRIDEDKGEAMWRRTGCESPVELAAQPQKASKFVEACVRFAEAHGSTDQNLERLKYPPWKVLAVPRWFVHPTEVAQHDVYGIGKTCNTYGPGLFPTHGIALLVGDPKTGKTTLLIDRLSRWKAPDGSHLRSVFISLESQATAMQGAASFEMDYPDGNTVQVIPTNRSHFDLLNPESVNRLAAEIYPQGKTPLSPEYQKLCGRIQRPHVLVLDSLSRAIEGLEENASGTMSAVVGGLEHLRQAMQADLLIAIHHTAKGKTDPRGHGSLLGGVDCSTHLSCRGHGDKAVITVRCADARPFEDGASFQYTRRTATFIDLTDKSLDLTRIEFDEVPDTAPAKPARAAPAPLATSAPAEAADAPAKAVRAAPAPSATQHPADRLRGRAAAVWAVVALKPGESMPLADAKAKCIAHPCFADVPKDRVGDRWKEVVAALTKKGLVDTEQGLVVNPQ